MIRRIIEINREKCNGCGACAAACHEGAIAMVDGKAQLMRDDYCDGLGDCRRSGREGEKGRKTALRLPRLRGAGHSPGGIPLRHQDAPAVPAAPVAGADQACARERAMVRRGEASGRRRLHGLRLCQFPSGFHQGPHHAGRLPQAGRRGLFRQAHGDSEAQRHPQHHGRSDGSPLLRRY